jgi:hypothetical protein
MLERIKTDTFMFHVNNQSITTTLFEIVLLLPAVDADLQTNPMCHAFELSNEI